MKTQRTLLLSMFLTLFMTTPLLAMNHGQRMDLTPEQMETVNKAHDEYSAATKDLRKELFARQSELNAQIYAEKPDQARIDTLVKDISALNGQIFAAQVKVQMILAQEGILPQGHGMTTGGMMGSGMGKGTSGCPASGTKAHGGMIMPPAKDKSAE